MPRTGFLAHYRTAGPPADGELIAGELALDLTTGKWWYSRDGATDVQLSGVAAGNLLAFDGTTSRWLNRTVAQLGLVLASQLGAANGVATLDANGKIPVAQLSALALTDVQVVGSEAAMLALDFQAGDFAIRSDTGVTYVHNGGTSGTITDYTLLPANDTSIDAAHIVAGNLAAARFAATVVAALNAAPAGTIANANLTIDCGSQ